LYPGAFASVSKKKIASIFKVEVSQFVPEQSESRAARVWELCCIHFDRKCVWCPRWRPWCVCGWREKLERWVAGFGCPGDEPRQRLGFSGGVWPWLLHCNRFYLFIVHCLRQGWSNSTHIRAT